MLIFKKIFVICNTFRHVISVDKKKGEQENARREYVKKKQEEKLNSARN